MICQNFSHVISDVPVGNARTAEYMPDQNVKIEMG